MTKSDAMPEPDMVLRGIIRDWLSSGYDPSDNDDYQSGLLVQRIGSAGYSLIDSRTVEAVRWLATPKLSVGLDYNRLHEERDRINSWLGEG